MSDAAPDLRAPDLKAPDLKALRELVRPTVLSGERTLPVPEVLRPLFPLGGLVRGSRLAVRGVAAVSLAHAVIAEASRAGSWVATVGLDAWGWGAAAHAGWQLGRSIAVAEPPASQWGTVVAALVDAVDVVVVDPAHQVTAADARRLAARSRERGAVVVEVAVPDGRPRFRWPVDADLVLRTGAPAWSGLDTGHGLLADRTVSVTSDGRRGAGRNRTVEVRLAVDGTLHAADTAAGTAAVTAAGAAGTALRSLRSVG